MASSTTAARCAAGLVSTRVGACRWGGCCGVLPPGGALMGARLAVALGLCRAVWSVLVREHSHPSPHHGAHPHPPAPPTRPTPGGRGARGHCRPQERQQRRRAWRRRARARRVGPRRQPWRRRPWRARRRWARRRAQDDCTRHRRRRRLQKVSLRPCSPPAVLPRLIKHISTGTSLTGWSFENDHGVGCRRTGWELLPRGSGGTCVPRPAAVRAGVPGGRW